ncbi:MAG TPA: MFS transporter [Cellulomonas sp.]
MPRRSPYSALFALPGVARLFAIAFLARLPQAMTGVVLTLHVVTTLHRGYGEAGLATAVMTVGMAVGAPWRGRLVDRLGLRRAVVPSVVVAAAVWFAAPHLPYTALLAAVFVGGVYLVPAFSVTRQSLSVLVPLSQQQTAFALDSIFVELTFMVAPLAGVWLATSVSSTAALTTAAVVTVLGGALLAWANPPTRSAGAASDEAAPAHGVGSLLSPALLVVLLSGVAAGFVLVGTDVALVAALNEAGRPQDIGWMVALWCLGSVAGGLAYGSRGRSVQPLVLVALLAAATLPLAFASHQPWLAVAIVVSGLPCAPSLSAINAALVRLVPEQRRGEVMGWSGTTSTIGNALGAPLVGAVIDRATPGGGFLTAACVGGVVAVGGLVVLRVARKRRAGTAPPSVAPAPAEADVSSFTDPAPAEADVSSFTDPAPADAAWSRSSVGGAL